MTTCSFLLDKSIFVGGNENDLCDFVNTHTVILAETLFYECYTDQELSDKKHFKRLEHLVKAGAQLSYQLMQIIRDEGQNLCPCISIIDYSCTRNFRSHGLRKENMITKEEVENKKNDRSKMSLGIKRLASTISEKLKFDNADHLKEICGWKMSRKERFRKWIEQADKNDIHDLAAKSFGKHVRDPKRFCLSPEWLSWHWAKLLYVTAWEYSYLKITGTLPKDEYAEHDSMDVEYLTFLAKCDALLARDKRVQDLAELAFPSKKVYSSIHEVDNPA